MKDKIWIGYSLLGELSTAPWGVIKYADGVFTLDKKAWCNKLQPAANEGANICRVLPFSLFGNQTAESVFQPFKYVGNGKWDLANYNDYYFPIMKEAIQIAKSLGVTLWREMFDHCGLWTGAGESVLHLNPMVNNLQGITDYYFPNEHCTAYVDKCLVEFGDTVKHGLGNELADHVMVNSVLPIFKAHNIVPFSYGADLDIPGEMASNSVRKMQAMAVEEMWGENEKVQLFHCCHKACEWTDERVFKPVQWWVYHSIAFSDDGVFPRPNGAQWADTIAFVLANQNIEVPQFGQGDKARLMFECCPETENPHLIIRAIVAECEKYGVTFANKGNVLPWIDPIEPEPPIMPEPTKPVWNWQGWWNNNHEAVYASIIGVIVLVVLLILIF